MTHIEPIFCPAWDKTNLRIHIFLPAFFPYGKFLNSLYKIFFKLFTLKNNKTSHDQAFLSQEDDYSGEFSRQIGTSYLAIEKQKLNK